MSIDRNTTILTITLFALTTGFSFFNLPLGIFIFTIGSSIILLRLYFMYRQIQLEERFPLHSFLYIFSPIPAILIIPAYFLKMMHIPGAGALMMLAYFASGLLAVFVLISYITQVMNKQKPSLTPYLLLFFSIIFLYIGNISRMSFSSNTIKESIVDKVIVENRFAEDLLIRQQKANEKLFSVLTDPVDSLRLIRQESKDLVSYITSVKLKLINNAGGVNEDGRPVGRFETTSVAVYLLGPEGSRKGEAYTLELRLKSFSDLCGKPYSFPHRYDAISDFGTQVFLDGTTLAEALLSLTHIQLQILQIENEYYLDRK